MLLASAWQRRSWKRQPVEEPVHGGDLSDLRTGGGQSHRHLGSHLCLYPGSPGTSKNFSYLGGNSPMG